jgi:hypothetical protein
MWICISGRQIDNLATLSPGTVTSWGGWHHEQRWRRLWSQLSASAGWRCTCPTTTAVGILILCCASLPMKTSGSVVLTKHSQASFYCSLHQFMRRKLNTLLVLFLNLGGRYLDQTFHFCDCGVRKPFFAHFGLTQGPAHIGLFQLYPTSLLCHSRSHVEIQQDISSCY